MFYVLKCYVNAYILHTYYAHDDPDKWYKNS